MAVGKSTQLRCIIAKNPDQLCEMVGALPFEIEIKNIVINGTKREIYFTILEEHKKFSNEMIKELAENG